MTRSLLSAPPPPLVRSNYIISVPDNATPTDKALLINALLQVVRGAERLQNSVLGAASVVVEAGDSKRCPPPSAAFAGLSQL